ncbi:MAG: DUF4169 family protein [Alphaproteobacteria bacterium]|nr:DUF4169 family protein [Alphaproteobacteria bacterium]
MAEVINLNQTRKKKARVEKEKTAAENRRIHGRTKQEKQQAKRDTERVQKHLDSHILDKDKPD